MSLRVLLFVTVVVLGCSCAVQAFQMCNFDNKIEVSETKVDSMSAWDFQVEQLQPDKKVKIFVPFAMSL